MNHAKTLSHFILPALLSLISLGKPAYAVAQLPAQGIEFFKGSMQQAIAKAKAEKKCIFLDAYASWCEPCKHMDKDIYSRADVADFFNNNFICVRMDMEQGEGKLVKQRYSSIDGYPSLLFLSPEGQPIKTILGTRSGSVLIDEAKLVLVN